MSIHEQMKVKDTDSGIMIAEIHHCARCNGNHQNIAFSRFKSPIVINRRSYWYWSMCPTLNEPIIMYKEEPRGKSKRRT